MVKSTSHRSTCSN